MNDSSMASDSSDPSEPHACCLYASEAERRSTLAEFVAAGLRKDQKVICALNQGDDAKLLQDLSEVGLDVAGLSASGHLAFLSAETAYLPDGSFHVQRGLGRIEELIHEGRGEGFSGVRTVGDLSWLQRAPDLRESFFEYEAEVNRLLVEHSSAALCMYPRTALSTGDQLRCLSVHPVAHVGGEVVQNPHFMSPDGLRGKDPIEASLVWRREAVEGMLRAEQTRSLLQTVLDTVEVAVLVVDREGRTIAECNEAAVRMFGYPRHELIGIETRELHVDEAHWREFGDESGRVLDEGLEYRADFRMRRADGTLFPTRHVVTLLHPESGRAGGVVSTVQDLTDEAEARRKESESRARFRAIAESITDGVLTVDTDNRVVYANPAAHAMMGVRDGALIGLPMTEMMPMHLRHRHGVAMNRYLDTGEKRMDLSRVEMPVLRADGTTFNAEISFGEYEAAGRRYFTGVIRDATERMRLESELRQSQKMEAVGRLASGVAHDFNNLLTLIGGSSEMIRRDLPADSPLHSDLIDVLDGVERAAALTRQLLAFSRAQVLEEQTLNLSELLSDVEPFLRRVVPSRIELDFEGIQNRCMVRGDPNELHRVVLNLALNASDAVDASGRIHMSVGTEALTADDVSTWQESGEFEAGRYVRLRVSDTGSGIPPDALDRIFDPFFTTKPEGRGTGLGLSSVLGIVQQVRGHIEVDSVVGEGTVFDLYFPEVTDEQATGGQATGDEGPARKPSVGAKPDSGDEGRGPVPPHAATVLVVEDDRALARVLARTLEREGYEVLSAPDGDQAIRLADESDRPIDVVLSDVVMPGPRGAELLKTLRSRHPAIRLILMSGHTSRELAGQIPSETDAFLAKPFSPMVLGETVRRVLMADRDRESRAEGAPRRDVEGGSEGPDRGAAD